MARYAVEVTDGSKVRLVLDGETAKLVIAGHDNVHVLTGVELVQVRKDARQDERDVVLSALAKMGVVLTEDQVKALPPVTA